MDIITKLAKLTAQVQSFMPAVDGDVIPELTSQDIAMAMAGLDSEGGPYLVILFKYVEDHGVAGQLKNKTLSKTVEMAIKRKWFDHRTPSPGLLQDLILGAIYELISPNTCHTCHGTGIIIKENVARSCNKCECTGKGQVADIVLAYYSNMSEIEFHRWRNEYEQIYALLTGWEMQGLGYVASKLDNP